MDHVNQPLTGLRWERVSGEPETVGISLSGGGIRSAMFSLGVIQVLQERQGLLFGPKSAALFSAVSGGSYIASAYVDNAVRLAQADAEAALPPFAPGSPEERHVLGNGRYLITPWSRIPKMLLGVAAGPVALVLLLVWSGFILADISLVVIWVSDGLGLPPWYAAWPPWAAIPLATLALLLVANGLFRSRNWRNSLRATASLVLLVVTLPPTVVALASLEWPLEPSAWVWPALAAFLFLVAAIGVSFIAGALHAPPRPFEMIERAGVALVMLVVIGGAAMAMVPLIASVLAAPDSAAFDPVAFVWIGGSLLAPFAGAMLLRRTSVHQFYREALRSSFGVVRVGSEASVPARPTSLSSLTTANGQVPRLLISATANVQQPSTRRRDTSAFNSFVFSHDQCGIPGTEMYFETTKLELALSDAYLKPGTESLVSLPTAVAATGAAISASMGRYSRPSFRLVLALFNIRLGRTTPNAARTDRRTQVAELHRPARIKTRNALLPGIDDLVAEMVGANGPNMYISDGGHYDNLGLITLLRARCSTIWCVDASPSKWGQVKDLQRARELAQSLGITLTFNDRAFQTTEKGVYPQTHLTAEIEYPGGGHGTIYVIKLGIHADDKDMFQAFRKRDKSFPHHSTLCQLYPQERLAQYRDLGRINAERCLKGTAQRP